MDFYSINQGEQEAYHGLLVSVALEPSVQEDRGKEDVYADERDHKDHKSVRIVLLFHSSLNRVRFGEMTTIAEISSFSGKRRGVRTNRLEEIVWRRIVRGHLSLALRGRVVGDEVALQILVHLHNRSDVTAAIAVVRGGPHGDELVVEHPLVALHHQLMRSAHHIEVVVRVELLVIRTGSTHLAHHVASEEVTTSSGAHSPARGVLLRIGPQQVAESALQRHFLNTVNRTDLVIIRISRTHFIQSGDRRRETAMHAEDAAVHKSTDGKKIEHVDTFLPDVGSTVLSHALVVKTVHLGDLPTLVVSTKKRNAVGVEDLQRKQEQKRFNAVVASVDIIAHEEVIRIGTVASDEEQLLQIVELTVDVSTDLEG